MANIINQSLLKGGSLIVTVGEGLMSKGASLTPVQLPLAQMQSFLNVKLPGILQGLLDGNYYLVDIATWKLMIQADWVHLKQYLTDKFDCDNFAFAFATHISELYDISVSTIYGQALDKNTHNLVGWHYWNTIPTVEADGSKHLWFFEPQTSNMTEVLGQEDIIIDNWIYKSVPGVSKVMVF